MTIQITLTISAVSAVIGFFDFTVSSSAQRGRYDYLGPGVTLLFFLLYPLYVLVVRFAGL